MGARGSMPLVDEVILVEYYHRDTAVLDSILGRTICEDLGVRWRDVGKGRSERSLCWDGSILLSTGVMTARIGGGLSHGGIESCSQEGGG